MHREIETAPPRWQLSSKCWVNCRRHLNYIHLEFNSECCSLVLHPEHRLKWRFAGAFSRPGRNNTATTWFCSLPHTGASLHPGGRMCALQGGLTCSSVAFRMLIKSKNDKIDVDINIRNSKDNAYNTKVTLTFTPNINFMKVEVRFPQRFFLSVSQLHSHGRVRFVSVFSDRQRLLSAPHQSGVCCRIPLLWKQCGGE